MTEAPPAPATRRAMIAERCRRSVGWRVIHTLGSLKLALLLLATIALACAIATVYESRFDTKVAQAYIYKAPWFIVWLGVLCVNLFAVTLTRWPWERKHAGFIITHYGIITLLIGAVIGSQFGFEGNVILHKGQPTDRVITSRSVVQVQNVATGDFALHGFDAEVARPTERRPREFAVPGSDWRLVVDAHADRLGLDERLEPVADPKAPPAVQLDFTTRMMGQELSLPFLLNDARAADRDFAGLARVNFTAALPAREPLRITETQMVFAKFAPVIQGAKNAATGVQAALSPDGVHLDISLPDGAGERLDRAKVIGQPQRFGDVTVTPLEYWPNFTLENGRPASAGDAPTNPAILLRVEAPRQALPGEDRRPRLEFAPDGEDRIAYQLTRGPWVVSRGTAKTGETFALGWADWTARVRDILPHARIEGALRPAQPGEAGPPGFRAHLAGPDGRTSPPRWIASGDSVTLVSPGPDVRVSYGLESRRVDFTIDLQSFEVPRFEGTDTPSDFIARVKFREPATGRTREDVARMNSPASWPGGLFALASGFNYKFSQVQWNPENLDETTLQVLHDPGWFLKWTGSLAICAGIFIMFYLRPRKP